MSNEEAPLMPVFDEMAPLLASVIRHETCADDPVTPRALQSADLRRFIQHRNDWHGRGGRRARGRKH